MATGIQVDPSQVQSINVDPSEVQAMPAAAQTAAQGSALSRFANGAWDYSGGGVWNLVKGITSLMAQNAPGQPFRMDPDSAGGKMIQGIVQGHIDQAQKAKAALDRGDYTEAFGHTLAAALPLMGPGAAHIAETAAGTQPTFDRYGNIVQPGQAPDLARAAGQVTGLGLSFAAPHAIAAVSGAPAAGAAGEAAAGTAEGAEGAPAAVGMVERVRSLTEVNPRVAAAKLYPGPANAPLISRAGEAFEDLKQFGGQTPETVLGNPKVGVENLAPTRLSGLEQSNIDTAIKNMQQQGLEPWMQRARDNGWTVPGNVIVQARVDAIPQMLWDESPGEARSLVAEAQRAFGGRQLTVDQARNLLVEKNKGSAPFQRQSTARQGTSEVGTTPSAIESADAAAIRTALYKTLDPENDGAGPAEIQRRTGNLIKLGNANEGQFSTIMAEKPATPAGALVQPIRNTLSAVTQGKPTALLRNALHPFRGPSDAMITELYRQAGPAKALPLPPRQQYVISRDQLGDFAKANDMTPAAAETRLLEEGFKVQ